MSLFRNKYIVSAAVLAGLFTGQIHAQEGTRSLKHDLGFWLGPSAPFPGTELDPILDSTIGVGAFYRFNRPWFFSTELGAYHAVYSSRTTQKVSLAPVYAALVYQLPIPAKFQFFLRAGAGSSYIEIRPQNRVGWEPMFLAGGEFAILASRHFRIGVRVDYNYIYESWMDKPADQELLLYYNLLQRPSDQPIDLRFYNMGKEFRTIDGEFMHFGIMMSFIL